MNPDSGTVHLARRGPAAFVTFERTGAHNTLTWSMYEQLATGLARIDAEEGLRVVVLRGAAGTFIAGTDIAQFTEFDSDDDGLAYEQRLEQIVTRLETLRFPTIAVIEGYAVGAGLVIAAACDLRIATPDCRFGMPIARTVGNCLSVANTARLMAHFGPARTTALLFTAGFISANDALAAGFLSEIVETGKLDARITELVDKISNHAPLTLQATKRAIHRIRTAGLPSDEDLLRLVYGSSDFREGVSAFLEKRPARWEGR